jgi:hypothetical protein
MMKKTVIGSFIQSVRTLMFRTLNFIRTRIKVRRFLNISLTEIESLNLPPAGTSHELHLVTFTYNNELLLPYQLKLLKKYLKDDFILVVADNSPLREKRDAIKHFCEKENVTYLSMPENPFNVGSNSHAICLNWICRNYYPRYKPAYIGFIDHDIYPVAAHKLTDMLNRQPVYGHLQMRGGGWYLWAGYCFFNAGQVNVKDLDFMPCDINGEHADTGGANWKIVYSGLSKKDLYFPEHSYIQLRAGDIPQSSQMEKIDNWIHSFNGSYWMSVPPKENVLFSYLDSL